MKPLNFTRINHAKNAQMLTLAFRFDDANNTPVKPRKKNPKSVLDYRAQFSGSLNNTTCLSVQHNSQNNSYCSAVVVSDLRHTARDFAFHLAENKTLKNHHATHYAVSNPLNFCLRERMTYPKNIKQSLAQYWQNTPQLKTTNRMIWAKIRRLLPSSGGIWQASGSLKICGGSIYHGQIAKQQQRLNWSKSQPIPCEFSEIILPQPYQPPPKPPKKQPQSCCLPMYFSREKRRFSTRFLPLPFGRGGDIFPLESYIVLNKISAKCGDIAFNIISFQAACDMNGYYWTVSITLPPDDFARINWQDKEVLIECKINDLVFQFLAENTSDTRQFGRRSYTLSGRSQTARLGADYARGLKGFVHQSAYAQQIARDCLADLGYTLNWNLKDWLVPANVYSLTDKTPMAVLADIAQAAGACVYSDTAKAEITLLPRWKVAAWQLSHAEPDLIIPSNVIQEITGQKQMQTQAHGVFVWGDSTQAKAADVKRSGSDGQPRATALTHSLYTDLTVCEQAGIAALSDSGVHKIETLKMPYLPKYGVCLPRLGDIWRVQEPSDAFNGVVNGIRLEVSLLNDVPNITMTVELDRYLGD